MVDFCNQNYLQLYKSLQHKSEKFEDPIFPAEPSSLRTDSTAADVEWLRPTELTARPRLIVNGVTGTDVMQGELGNAWFVTASAAITTKPSLFAAVLPNVQSQEYSSSFHPGIFLFQFHRLGKLYKVVIDDRLPTKRGRLLYCQSGDSSEFWSALLEKAYAKLHGDYHCLKKGRCVDALSAFARGLPEHWELSELRQLSSFADSATKSRIWKLFCNYLGRDAVLVFSVHPSGSTRLGDWTKENFVIGRGYILCKVGIVQLKEGASVMLLQLQNSWSDLEWNGAWCDGSPNWNKVTEQSKTQIKYEAKADGLFWISIEDALKMFTDIDICVPNSSTGSSTLVSKAFTGEWTVTPVRPRSEINAGGSYDYPTTYARNPQYLLRIRQDSSQTVSLCLEQGTVSSPCHTENLSEIGIDVFRVEINRECRLKEPPEEERFVGRIEPICKPNIFLGASYRPGTYVVVPCTQRPNCQQKFSITAFSQADFLFRPLTELAPSLGSCCSCCYWSRCAVTRFRILKITGAAAHVKRKNLQLKVKLSCEGSDINGMETDYCSCDKDDTNCHTLDFSLLLYRHNLEDAVNVDVYYRSSNSMIKHFLGQTRFADIGCKQNTAKEGQLFADGESLQVHAHCEVQISGDVTYF